MRFPTECENHVCQDHLEEIAHRGFILSVLYMILSSERKYLDAFRGVPIFRVNTGWTFCEKHWEELEENFLLHMLSATVSLPDADNNYRGQNDEWYAPLYDKA